MPCRRVLKGLTLRCMTSKENNYSFSHAPCLSPFKLSLSDHLLTWNGIRPSIYIAIQCDLLKKPQI
ncbi:hypothetical protein [Paraglaciecola chathamensis]|uniref:hypothetical protein n=1 Tax=Paraglaciecola chathamensis TaxID=368405 RepID=UPI0039B77718